MIATKSRLYLAVADTIQADSGQRLLTMVDNTRARCRHATRPFHLIRVRRSHVALRLPRRDERVHLLGADHHLFLNPLKLDAQLLALQDAHVGHRRRRAQQVVDLFVVYLQIGYSEEELPRIKR